jgi:hypothetical protein
MTRLLAGHFSMPERKIQLTKDEKDDLLYLMVDGTEAETPIKTRKKKVLSKGDKAYNQWHSSLRIGVEHAIGRMKKFKIFADIHRGNGQKNMIAKNVAALANINLKMA